MKFTTHKACTKPRFRCLPTLGYNGKPESVRAERLSKNKEQLNGPWLLSFNTIRPHLGLPSHSHEYGRLPAHRPENMEPPGDTWSAGLAHVRPTLTRILSHRTRTQFSYMTGASSLSSSPHSISLSVGNLTVWRDGENTFRPLARPDAAIPTIPSRHPFERLQRAEYRGDASQPVWHGRTFSSNTGRDRR